MYQRSTLNCSTILIIISVMLLPFNEAKVYDRCEFARLAKRKGLNHVATWTCIANYESHFNTKAINQQTKDYGILQISSIFWCSNSNTPGKGCGITCKSLLGDDISIDLKCAKHIYDDAKNRGLNGFSPWTTYSKYCMGNQNRWIEGCHI